jgi:hypothetical protein
MQKVFARRTCRAFQGIGPNGMTLQVQTNNDLSPMSNGIRVVVDAAGGSVVD